MTDLRSRIAVLAGEFATEVLAAIRSASLDEISRLGGDGAGRAAVRASAGPRAQAPGRVRLPRARAGARRNAADHEKIVTAIVELLGTKPEGLRAEHFQKELGLGQKDLARPIQIALASKKIRKRGQKRSTTYFTT